jgi:hypothetical protein
MYSGIPEKKEEEFDRGFFGCCTPKPKVYSVSNQESTTKK